MPNRRARPSMGGSMRQSPSRDLTLQQYIQLSTQQDNLRHRLSLTIPTTSPLSPSSPTFESFSTSPIRLVAVPSNYHNSVSTYLSSSHPTQPIPVPGSYAAMDSSAHTTDPHDEDRLADINHQIKATLTELLNHESVKGDEKLRHWVQERLIDAEMELRRQKRRSRRRSSMDRDAVASSIAESFRGPGLGMDGTWRFGTTV